MELTTTQAWNVLNAFLSLPSQIVVKNKKYQLKYSKKGKMHYLYYIHPIYKTLAMSQSNTDFTRLLIDCYHWICENEIKI